MDEDVLEPRLDLMPFVLVGAERRDCPLEQSSVASAHVQHVAERHRLLCAGTLAQLFGQLGQILAAHGPSRSALISDYFVDRSVRQQFAMGIVSEPMTPLFLSHVEGRASNRSHL